MYCNNCGKEIMAADKFCPYCGSVINKKITFDVNMTPESIKKRAFILLEDEDFQTAEEYLDGLLDVNPEDGEVYLGKLLAQNKFRNTEQLVDYYKNLYSSAQYSLRVAELPDGQDDHIEEMANEYAIDHYLGEEDIKDKYYAFDETFQSLVSCREKQEEQITSEFDNNRLISRVRQFSDKKTKKIFTDILDEYDRRLKDAESEDKKNIERIIVSYPLFIRETDQAIKDLHKQRMNQREEDYLRLIGEFNTEMDIDALKEFSKKCDQIGIYKDVLKYKEKCEERIFQLEAEEKALQEKKRQENKRKMYVAAAVFAGLVLLLVLYQNLIVPMMKYNSAQSDFENGEYEKALAVFEELGDYKDAKEMASLSKYHQALDCLDKKEYEKAVVLLKEVDPIEDSSVKLTEARYHYGKSLLEKKAYDSAIKVLELTKEFLDSEELIKQAKYEKAVSLRENKDYDASLKVFEELAEYKDSEEQAELTEKEKTENSVAIPSVIGKTLEDAKKELDKAELIYEVSESEDKNQKIGTVMKVSPDVGTLLLKGSKVTLTVAKGSSKYSNYDGDHNSVALFQVNVLNSGNNLRIRKAPTTADDNKIENAKAGNVFNVYEVLRNEGYDWYRIGDRRWIAYDAAWLNRDSICDQRHGSFEIYNAVIHEDDHIGVYSNPVEDANQRSWVRAIYNGETVKIYYTFNNGSHTWYKVGVNEWIKDGGGDRVVR